MKQNPRTFLKKFAACALAVAGAFAALRALGAPSVLMPPPPVNTQPSFVSQDQTNNELSAFIPSYQQMDDALPQPLRFGPVTFRPHPFYSFLYVSGLQNGTNHAENSIIQQISPGISVDLGRHWTLDYTPTIQLYSNHDFRDAVNHSATLTGGTRYEDWLFGFSQSFAQSDATLAETAVQTHQQNFDTELTTSYLLNEKFFLNFGLSQKFNFADNLQDSREWSTLDWLNYEFNKRLVVGVGVGIGYVNVQGNHSPNQLYEQMQARVQWRVTDKLSLTVNGGFDERQFLAKGYDSSLNPIFGASILYAPFEQTQLSLDASRAVSTSSLYILSQTTEGTSVSANLNQRLLKKYNLHAGLGYTHTDYTVALGPFSANLRNDDVYSFNVRLSRSFLKRGNVAVTYQYSDNRSSQAGFTYRSNQVGCEIGFAY